MFNLIVCIYMFTTCRHIRTIFLFSFIKKFNWAFISHRYCRDNVRMSSLARVYSEEVPPFLRDRPRFLVNKCRDTITTSKTISSNRITDIGDGKYEITGGAQTYSLDMKAPDCQCLFWADHSLHRWVDTYSGCRYFETDSSKNNERNGRGSAVCQRLG